MHADQSLRSFVHGRLVQRHRHEPGSQPKSDYQIMYNLQAIVDYLAWHGRNQARARIAS